MPDRYHDPERRYRVEWGHPIPKAIWEQLPWGEPD